MFLLKAFDARDRETNAQNPGVRVSRPTLHGLANCYSRVTNIPPERIEAELAKAGFSLGGTVDFDSADSANEEGGPKGQRERRCAMARQKKSTGKREQVR